MDAAGVTTESEFRAQDKVYYPSALRLAPTPSKFPVDSSSVPPSSTIIPGQNPSSASIKGKGKGEDLPPITDVVVAKNEEDVVEVVHSKRKKKDKKQGKKGTKEKLSIA